MCTFSLSPDKSSDSWFLVVIFFGGGENILIKIPAYIYNNYHDSDVCDTPVTILYQLFCGKKFIKNF